MLVPDDFFKIWGFLEDHILHSVAPKIDLDSLRIHPSKIDFTSCRVQNVTMSKSPRFLKFCLMNPLRKI